MGVFTPWALCPLSWGLLVSSLRRGVVYGPTMLRLGRMWEKVSFFVRKGWTVMLVALELGGGRVTPKQRGPEQRAA